MSSPTRLAGCDGSRSRTSFKFEDILQICVGIMSVEPTRVNQAAVIGPWLMKLAACMRHAVGHHHALPDQSLVAAEVLAYQRATPGGLLEDALLPVELQVVRVLRYQHLSQQASGGFLGGINTRLPYPDLPIEETGSRLGANALFERRHGP